MLAHTSYALRFCLAFYKNFHCLNSSTLYLAKLLEFSVRRTQKGFVPFKDDKQEGQLFCKYKACMGLSILCYATPRAKKAENTNAPFLKINRRAYSGT